MDESLLVSCQDAAEVLVDRVGLRPPASVGSDLISPNRDEAIHLTGQSASDPIRLAKAVSACTGVAHAVVTLDVEPRSWLGQMGPRLSTMPVKVTDAAGAEIFIAGIAAERRREILGRVCTGGNRRRRTMFLSQVRTYWWS